MRYGRGKAGNGVGSRKHTETCRRGKAKYLEQESLGLEKRHGKKAKNSVKGFSNIYHLVLHFLECCEAWRASKIQADAKEAIE